MSEKDSYKGGLEAASLSVFLVREISFSSRKLQGIMKYDVPGKHVNAQLTCIFTLHLG